jgi:hypothetical protein
MMAYGSDITQAIPVPLSNPAGSTNYAATGVAYDVAIGGQPFFVNATDDTPYRRVTAQYRKQQIDQTREPGEQTLTGWWLRSQSSFHLGAGIKFFEPINEESLRFQYTESKGLDVWTKGQATLLNSTVRARTAIANNLYLVGARDTTNNVDAVVFTEGPDLKKLTMSGDTPTVTTYTLVTVPHTLDFISLTSDGTRYFAADNARIHRGNIFGTTSDGHIYDLNGPVTTVVMRYAKQRLLAGVDRDLYELDSNRASTSGGHSLPTALYEHPNPSWVWTTISEGPAAFYAGGYAGSQSSLYKITLDTANANALGFPELNVPTVVVDLPEGEIINAFDVYLGTFGVLCTNKGVRVALVSPDGDISYGPLLIDTECKSVTFKDKFAYVTTLQGTESGLIRIDLSQPAVPNSLIFAYAWDVYASGETNNPVATDFLGATDRVVFAIPGDGIWVRSITDLVPEGYLRTGYIRYNTLETKIYKLLQARVDTTDGGLGIDSIDSQDTYYRIGNFGQGSDSPEINISYPTAAEEYLGFQFNLSRSDTDASKGPLFTGYQIKALPAIPRQRLIQFPLFCYDHESDKFGVESGYEGSAYDRMSQLEAIENVGDTIRVEDFRTNESFIGLIEEMDFINKTPSGPRFSGYGGSLIVTIRTV